MDYISENEIDGDVKPILIKAYNRFIRVLRSVFNIHCFTKGAHSKKSMHYKGLAGDGHKGNYAESRRPTIEDENILIENLMKIIHKKDKSIFEQAVLAKLSGFEGIGIYPDWYPKAGLHCDMRDNSLAWVGLNAEKLRKKLEKTKDSQIYVYLV